MNRNAIRLAVAALLPLAASSAWALDPAATQAIPASNTIYISGSTAIDTALQAFFELSPSSDSRAPCVVGTTDIYKSATGYILSCTASSVVTGVAGQNIAIAKQTQGGSAIGIVNVARGTAANGFTNKATLVASSGAPVNTAATGPFAEFNTYTVSSAEVALSPNAGVSDLDPITFVGTGGVLASDAAAVTAVHGLQQPFGVIVSVPLFRALQAAEGLTANDAIANVPSLTTAQLRAILSGQMLDWADLYVYDKANHAVQTQVGNGSAAQVHICRRGNTSGTELGANTYFFGAGCSKGSGLGSIAPPDTSSTATDGVAWNATNDPTDFVFAGSGTGDVKKCVSAPLAAGDAQNFRIGFIGTDNKSSDGAGDTWRYVAINEQPGTLFSILQGRYDFLTENTLNSTTASLAQNGGAGNHASIWNYLANNVGNRVSIAGYNARFQGAWDLAGGTAAGDSGVLTLGKATGVADALTPPLSSPTWPAAVRSLTSGQGPASTVSKTYPGSPTNNCNGILQVNPTG
jgi:hypothetical protein